MKARLNKYKVKELINTLAKDKALSLLKFLFISSLKVEHFELSSKARESVKARRNKQRERRPESATIVQFSE